MGNEGSKMTFLRLAYYRDSEWGFRVFEACLVWGNAEDRTAGNERERDRVRESERAWGRATQALIPLRIWAKVIVQGVP